MSEYIVAIGDWSGDGHEKHNDFIVEIPEEFTPEILGENFARNVDAFGFGPHSFANEHDDNSIPKDKLETLKSYGLDASEFDEWDGVVSLFPSDMLKIVMLYFGYGLEGFSYTLKNDPRPPALIGYWSKVTAKAADRDHNGYGVSVGYGLFN